MVRDVKSEVGVTFIKTCKKNSRLGLIHFLNQFKCVFEKFGIRGHPQHAMTYVIGAAKLLVIWKQGLEAVLPNRLWTWHIQWHSNETQLIKFEISQQLMLRFE